MKLVFALSTAVFCYFLTMLLFQRVFAKRLRLSERLTETMDAGDMAGGEYKKQELLSQKIMKAVTNALLDFLVIFIPKSKNSGKLEDDLKKAHMDMTVERYKASLLMKMGGFGLAGFLLGKVMSGDLMTSLLYAGGGLYAAFTLERFSLQGKIKKRKEQIYHAFPDMMDLLNVSVTAGLGFDQAISYISDKGEGPLYEELAVTEREITLGKSRKEALNSFADRCGENEIRTFVGACIQADEMGSSLQNILRIQSDTIREAHKQDIETEINKLPIKILFPIIFCIFPCLFMVLLGPAALTALEAFK